MTRWWRSHSVRVRLTAWYITAMVVVLGVYVFAVYAVVRGAASDSLDQELRRDFGWAAASVYQDDDGSFAMTDLPVITDEDELPWVQVWSADGSRRLFASEEALRRPLAETQSLATASDDRIVVVPTQGVPMRVLTRRGGIAPAPKSAATPVVIQVARSEAAMRQQLQDLTLMLLLGLPIAVAAAGLGGYVVARRALAPIERMTERAHSITAERLSARLPVGNPDDEMGRLALVFNGTLARLEHSFEQMRRFTADVSHQLRTPLTAIRSVGEVGLRGHRDDQAYRGIIGSMLEEADRLAGLVDRLLVLSRAETSGRQLSLGAMDLRGLAEEVATQLEVLAEEKRQTLVVDPDGSAPVLADRLVLRQAVINVVDNAIKYTPLGGTIRIRVSDMAAGATLDVVDSGPGIPLEARTRLFDRFSRSDAGDGGSGLGLSIARGAVEAHGGHLTLERSGQDGSTFRITVPRTQSKTPGLS